MKLTKWFSGLPIVVLLLSLLAIGAAPASSHALAGSTIANSGEITRIDQGPPPRPTVSVVDPEDGAIIALGAHTITVSATDSTGITGVAIKIDGPESSNGWVDITASDTGDNYYHYHWNVSTEGDYSITARATNAVGRHADDIVGVTVTATPPAPDFTLDASPSTLTIVLGSSDTSTITVTSLNGFNEAVDLTVSGEPAEVTVSLSPTQIIPPADGSATSLMTLTVGTSATTGTYTLTVTGTSGSLVHTIDVGLEITAPPSFYTLTVHVQDDVGAAIEGATVTADGSADTTDSLGNAVFPDLEEGTYTVTASKTGYTSASDTVVLDAAKTVTLTLTPISTFDYELFIEIDYMQGNAPTPEVLDYIEWYYMGNNPSGELIKVTFYVDDVVPVDGSVSDTDFWNIEASYNDLGDDKYTGKSANFVSKWKWVLFGTSVEGEPDVVGYTYVLTRGSDLLAGNYIFIADANADQWATANGVYEYGAEAVVLMHEMGHSIGIANYHPARGEIYDPDPGSVMSYLSVNNASLYWSWYYSASYWDTRNMEYYTVS